MGLYIRFGLYKKNVNNISDFFPLQRYVDHLVVSFKINQKLTAWFEKKVNFKAKKTGF